MIKNFSKFSKDVLNESVAPFEIPTLISPDSAYWQKAFDFFKKETGKDLVNFKWVFKDNDINEGIWPENFVVALFSASPTLSRYKGFIEYIKNFLSEGNLEYIPGDHDGDFMTTNNSLSNSKALYNTWVKHFYMPIKNAVVTKNFSSISIKGMEQFEERMQIYTMDLDTDWKNFFGTIQVALQPVSSDAIPTQQEPTPTRSKNKAPQVKKQSAGYVLPSTFK